MSVRIRLVWFRVLSLGVLWLAGLSGISEAKEILVSDRLTNSVLRYSTSGSFLGTLLTDNTNLNQPNGIAVSPNLTKLYVTSSQNNKVIQYDYNYLAGTASNPSLFASAGLFFPNNVVFNPAGNKIYVSNLGGSVNQYNLDGTDGSAVSALVGGGDYFQFSGLAFAPGGELMVGAFQDFSSSTKGAIAKSNGGITAISDFIAGTTTLNGAGNILVNGDDLYATAGFAGRINKYDATTGALAGGFTAPTGLAFPASLILAPDRNGILAGILGFVAGEGSISRFGFDGTPLGVFAPAQANPLDGFREATGMLVVPEPSSFVLLGIALATLGFAARRRQRHTG